MSVDDSSDSETTGKPVKLQPPVLISNSLPPVPAELVQRVEEGLFIEMAELSPNALDSAGLNMEKRLRSPKHLYVISDIVEWVQCFGIYVAIVSRSKPARVADLIGYQSLIIGASQNCREGKWTIYDRRFRLKASASRSIHWSRIDITIWNMTFPDKAISGRQSSVVPRDLFEPNFSQRTPRSQFLPKTRPICLDWNDNPNGCTRPTCRYDHLCYRCVHNPKIPDKRHKASQCPARQRDRQQGSRP